MTDEELDALAGLVSDPDVLLKLLPEDEHREYQECIQSVIDARRAGERIAHELWIG